VVSSKKKTTKISSAKKKKPSTFKPKPEAAAKVLDSTVRAVAGSVKFKKGQQKPTTQRLSKKFSKKTIASFVSNVNEVCIDKDLPLHEVAILLGKDLNEIVLMLLQKSLSFTRNQLVPKDVIAGLAGQLEISVSVAKKASPKKTIKQKNNENLITRWPVVVVMGHVDHGKTTFLDFVRKASVAAKETGGITQHLGAYEVETSHGKVVFMDTPGHAAFSRMRGRGVAVTDLVVLIIAADDGVMPQTVEAIEQAKKAEVPIIVAINKVDKDGADQKVETIKRQLAQHDVLVEDWGGSTICLPISAKTGAGIESLLEMLVLQAQMMELTANPNAEARAFVLESKCERGYGPVSTVITVEGTLRKGDYFTCGSATGKIRLLVDSFGNKIAQAGISVPVMIAGFDSAAKPGEWLQVVNSAVYSKARSLKTVGGSAAANMFESYDYESEDEILKLIIKSDTHGSSDAIRQALETLGKKNKRIASRFRIISNSVGELTEKDVLASEDFGALLVSFNAKIERSALLVASQRDIKILSHKIIYHLVDDIEKEVISMIKKVKVFEQVGKAKVLKVFKMKGRGVIAGCSITDGLFSRGDKVVCLRAGEKVGEGKISSLQRDRSVVKEVAAGYECGFICEGFTDWLVDDEVLCMAEQDQDSLGS
jgi:translation initiation factor IF-2